VVLLCHSSTTTSALWQHHPSHRSKLLFIWLAGWRYAQLLLKVHQQPSQQVGELAAQVQASFKLRPPKPRQATAVDSLRTAPIGLVLLQQQRQRVLLVPAGRPAAAPASAAAAAAAAPLSPQTPSAEPSGAQRQQRGFRRWGRR